MGVHNVVPLNHVRLHQKLIGTTYSADAGKLDEGSQGSDVSPSVSKAPPPDDETTK